MSAYSNEVVIVSAVRTAIGSFGGALKGVAATDLATLVVKEAFTRAGLSSSQGEQIVFGNVLHTEARDMYLARVAGVGAGMPHGSSALTLNRLCGSGLQAIVSAFNAIQLGDCECAVGGGVETMSRALYALPSGRWGARMGDAPVIDMMTGALTDPFGAGHMGITAENVAERFGISREAQDQFSFNSHQKAIAAIKDGRFQSQIVPVEIPGRNGATVFDTDEHPKEATNLESLSKLRPAFRKGDGTVTAGNSSGINDGAAACLLMSREAADQHKVRPLARIVSYAVVGVDPAVMGTGPIPAVQLALKRAQLTLDDMAVIESNEAFAAQSLGVCSGLGLDPARTNPNGGAIALGHPLGASGAIITVKCVYELQRIRGRYGLITMCIGGGQGIAMVIERLE